MNLLRDHADASLIQEAKRILNKSPNLPDSFTIYMVTNPAIDTLQPETLNARQAVELIQDAYEGYIMISTILHSTHTRCWII